MSEPIHRRSFFRSTASLLSGFPLLRPGIMKHSEASRGAQDGVRVPGMREFLASAASSRPALMETAMDADRRRVQPWFACPRIFIKDSGRSELGPSDGDDSARLSQRNVPDTREWEAGPRRKGDIAQLVRRIAAHGGNAFRLSVYWGGEVYYQSTVAPHAPGLGDIDYLEEA
jgi:hypothetical protein